MIDNSILIDNSISSHLFFVDVKYSGVDTKINFNHYVAGFSPISNTKVRLKLINHIIDDNGLTLYEYFTDLNSRNILFNIGFELIDKEGNSFKRRDYNSLFVKSVVPPVYDYSKVGPSTIELELTQC